MRDDMLSHRHKLALDRDKLLAIKNIVKKNFFLDKKISIFLFHPRQYDKRNQKFQFMYVSP